jgi:hypothetical protein
MTRVHFNGPPELIQMTEHCLVCLMVARGAELDALAEQWGPLEKDGHDATQKWFAWDSGRTLIRDAVVYGISDVIPQAGRVPLCWDHLAGLTFPKPSARLANGRGIPPGLLKGRG